MENGSKPVTRAELKIELEATKAELKAELKTELVALRAELQDSIRDSQTEILRAIHGYVEASEARLVRLERNDKTRAETEFDVNRRLAALEVRLFEIERRLIIGGKGAA